MSTARPWTDAAVAADARVGAVSADMRAARNSAFVNNLWRALANQPGVLERDAATNALVDAPGVLRHRAGSGRR